MKLNRLTVIVSGSVGCRAWIKLMITCMCPNLYLIGIANYIIEKTDNIQKYSSIGSCSTTC